jgi:hypothetical protein
MYLLWKIKRLYEIKRNNKINRKTITESEKMIKDLKIKYPKENLWQIIKAMKIIDPKETLWEIICNSAKSTIRKIKRKLTNDVFEPSLEKIIDNDFSDDRMHKTFFKKAIGKHFDFNIYEGSFFEYMEFNKGKATYKEAVDYYNFLLRIKSIDLIRH